MRKVLLTNQSSSIPFEVNLDSEQLLSLHIQKELIEFTRDLVCMKSFSGQEEEVVRFIAQKMMSLGYDEVTIDAMGSVVGKIGNGEKVLQFDSHVDTVTVNDENEWDYSPFNADIVEGQLYGRGSVDMKSGAAASIFAGALAKRSGFLTGKTIYVSCSVFEEDCDGENLKNLYQELNFKPHYVVICEPSENKISLGHKGKAQVCIKTHGISAHGSAPEKGLNAVYEMAEIIQRVETTNADLMQREAPRGTLVLSNISCTTASLNAVPSECEIYLDRRMAPGETEAAIRQEMDRLIEGKKASWEVGTLHRTCWTGKEIVYKPFHLAWKIDLDHELTRACSAAYQEYYGKAPDEYSFWDFSTNAVTPVGMGIPVIGFGPGDQKLAHMQNERCDVQQIIDACGFYTRLIQHI